MAREIQISDAEWQVMNVLWQESPQTAGQVAEALECQLSWSPRTVKTLLHRLVKKGALRFQSLGNRYQYSPRVSRLACVKQESRSFLERVFGGREVELLEFFVEQSNLSPRQIRQLKQLLDQQGRGCD